MRSQRNSLLTASLVLIAGVAAFGGQVAQGKIENDTDNRLINAKVVEVSAGHISVIARTGVEHVIAIDPRETTISLAGRTIAVADVREGDIVTVELDAYKQVKFAKNMSLTSAPRDRAQLAKNSH